MKRLVLNSLVVGLCLGLLVAGLSRLEMIGRSVHPDFLGWKFVVTTTLVGGGGIFLIQLALGLVGLQIQRRLIRQFNITPGEGGYRRTVTLVAPAETFSRDLRHLIVERLKPRNLTNDPARAFTFSCLVTYSVRHDYLIRVTVSEDRRTAELFARRDHILAPLVPVDLESTQIVAGLLQWAADNRLVVRDFGSPIRPDRIDRDLGNWVPRSNRTYAMDAGIQRASEKSEA